MNNQTSSTVSTKDLSFFCDMFNWNLNCYNAFTHFANEITDETIKQSISSIADMHKESCEYILGMVKGGQA